MRAALLVLSCASYGGSARADAGTCVSVRGDTQEFGAELIASFSELLRRHVGTRLAGESADCDAQVVVELDARAEPIVLRVHAEPDDGQTVVRLVGRAGTPVLTRETLAHAMYGSVSPWLEPVPPPPPLPPPPPQPPARVPVDVLRVRMAGGAGAVWWSGASPDARVFAQLALLMRAPRARRVTLDLGGSVARADRPDGLALERRSGFARLGAGAALFSGAKVELAATVTLGADLLAVEAADDPARYERPRAQRALVPSAGAVLALSVALSARSRVVLASGIDVAWRRLRFVASGEPDATFYVTPRVLPFVNASVTFDVFRDTRFEEAEAAHDHT